MYIIYVHMYMHMHCSYICTCICTWNLTIAHTYRKKKGPVYHTAHVHVTVFANVYEKDHLKSSVISQDLPLIISVRNKVVAFLSLTDLTSNAVSSMSFVTYSAATVTFNVWLSTEQKVRIFSSHSWLLTHCNSTPVWWRAVEAGLCRTQGAL